MSQPCEQAEIIVALEKSQHEQSKKIDAILETLRTQTETFNSSIKELTQVLLQNARHGEVLLQLKKENDLIFNSLRDVKTDVQAIKERNAKCDGAGIFENFPKIWDWYTAHRKSDVDIDKMWKWYLGELGWRRFLPAVLAVISTVMAIYISLHQINTHDHGIALSKDPRGAIKQDVGVDVRNTH